jgi:hypothetical protein
MAGRAAAHRAAVEREPAAVQRALQTVLDDLPLGEQGARVRAVQAEGVQVVTPAAEDGGQPIDLADLPVRELAVRTDADQPRVIAAAPPEDLDDAQHDAVIFSHFGGAFQGGAPPREPNLECDSVL